LNISSRTVALESVACGVCGSTNSQPYASGKDFEYDTSSDNFAMVLCLDCTNVYLNPRPTKSELATIYPPNYYAYNYDTAIHPIARKGKDILDARKIKGWLKYISTATPMFLDVGCGNGRYLRMLHKFGVPKENLYGVELDRSEIEQVNAEGFHGVTGRIEDVVDRLPQGQFDLIVLLQVLEHVEDPASIVRHLTGLLKVGGVLIVETPNTESIDAQIFKKRYWGGYHFPRHWNLFNKATLARLAQSNGLQVRACNFLPAHSFWIFSFHHAIAENLNNKWLEKMFDPCTNVPLLAVFTGFDIVRAALGSKTSNIQFIAAKVE
jgi:SAM-dependent methyltransferase